MYSQIQSYVSRGKKEMGGLWGSMAMAMGMAVTKRRNAAGHGSAGQGTAKQQDHGLETSLSLTNVRLLRTYYFSLSHTIIQSLVEINISFALASEILQA